MNKIYLSICIFSFSLCSSCLPQQDNRSAYEKDLYKKAMVSEEIKNCKKNGGVVQGAGLLGIPNCVITYPDAGKSCKNSSECTHKCLLIGKNIPMGAPAVGECKPNSLSFGCYAPVEDGPGRHFA